MAEPTSEAAPAADFQNHSSQSVANVPVSEKLPSEAQLAAIYGLTVLDKDGKSIEFSTLVKDPERPRTLVVFVRHFFCGSCQDYVRALSSDLPPSRLSTSNTNLIIIGCGDPSIIPQYAQETSCPFPIYADPSRKIYQKFEFAQSRVPAQQAPGYIKRSFLQNALASFASGFRSGRHLFSGGNTAQNGGDLFWVDGQLRFVHRMTNSQDHLEVRELEAMLRL